MILTDKAKDDFYSWTQVGNLVNMMDDLYLHALIIKWFDSVGVYIDTQLVVNFDESEITKVCWFVNIATSNGCYNSDESYESRQQSKKEAITKANQIYNEKFSG